MKSRVSRLVLVLAVFGELVWATGQARADILLNLIDPPAQSDTPFALSFAASDSTTTVSIGGYQVPEFEQVTNNGLFLDGTGPNLLGGTWAYTPAPSGGDSSTFSDGTSVPALSFGAVVVGAYDTYSQTIATIPGQSYSLDFLFSNSTENSPSGLLVTTSATSASVPEPSTTVLLVIGALTGLVIVECRRKAIAAR